MNKISVKGMSCGHCSAAVKEALEGAGLINVEVDLASGTATFDEAEADMSVLRDAIDEAGFELG